MQSKQRILDSRISFNGISRSCLAISLLLAVPCFASHGIIAQKWLDGCASLELERSLSSLKGAAPDKYGKWNPLRFIFSSKGPLSPVIACDLATLYEEAESFDGALSIYVQALKGANLGSVIETKLLRGAIRCARKLDKKNDLEKYNTIYRAKYSHLPTIIFSDRLVVMIPKSFCTHELRKELFAFEKAINACPATNEGKLVQYTTTPFGLVFVKAERDVIQEIKSISEWDNFEYPFECVTLSSSEHNLDWLRVMRKSMQLLQEENFNSAISCLEKAVKKFDLFKKEELSNLSEKEQQVVLALGSALLFEQFQSHFSRQYGDCGELALLQCMQLMRESSFVSASIRKNVLKTMISMPGPGAFQVLHRVASNSLPDWKISTSCNSIDGLFFIESTDQAWIVSLENFLKQCGEQADSSSILQRLRSCTRTPSGALLLPEFNNREEINKIFSLILCAFMEQYQNFNDFDKDKKSKFLGTFSSEILVPLMEIGYSGL